MDDELKDVRSIVASLHAALDTQPYHVFLGVEESAAGDALRMACHARAQLLHPDRFYDLEDAELGVEPVLLSSAAPDDILARFVAWADERMYTAVVA